MTQPSKLSPTRLVRKFMPINRDTSRSGGWLPGHGFALPLTGPDARRSVGASVSLGRIGSLEVRLARKASEIKKAQELRYHVFYEEMSAIADGQTLASGRDADTFDEFCDHLLVLDHDVAERAKPFGRRKPRIVATYRLLRQSVAERFGGFYTAGEYDIQPLLDAKPDLNFLELGRSCVLKPYRTKRTVELLWHGIWAYVLMHGIDAMIGCASFEGTDPDRLALPLSYLHHCARAPEEWRVRALDERYVEMNRLPPESVDMRAALREMPPLIKGYLRLGAHIGDGAVIDHQFGTTDALIILPVASLNSRYINYYGSGAERFAS
ncbi:ornithine-acyl[acyl carrier protein] N-acyltransferase [Breoghania corrubedonensis]|uniref:L-ornithine N(alpha)-acyltransferase n=1 Tax=Breoghania corrubedonensis TaxID=665038 RepID=A0A2T5VHK4_9HYPH|nr:GNAT family N-acyltransferase [Breoghania corrubedonensis]PTW63224.1 ornithine-acyl[acyl carrier protein] N-acyltransferase [Breoghania corrubedonensis]